MLKYKMKQPKKKYTQKVQSVKFPPDTDMIAKRKQWKKEAKANKCDSVNQYLQTKLLK